jgi:hypothetical protein
LADAGELIYDLRTDGVSYRLAGDVRVRVQKKSKTRTCVSMQRGNVTVPPETGDLGTGTFRSKLVELARERLGEVNGLADDLDLISIAFEDHLGEREEAAAEDDRENNEPALQGSPYRIRGGGFVRLKQTLEGEIPQRLTNFTARITEEIIKDDGAEERRLYRISGEAGDRQLPEVEVSAGQFGSMSWTSEKWGLSARITAGQGVRDCAREAIELLSFGAKSRRLYAHTGWRTLPSGEHIYLHARGAVGTGEDTPEVEVELEPGLERYVLPVEATPEEISESVRVSLALLDLAPERIMAPLLASAYLAPMSDMIPPDFALWLWGGTGSFKSTLAALVLSHYGDFTEASLPGSFESTANAQERLLFLLKDSLAVVDDWRPAVSRGDASEMDRKAQRLLRAVGNRQGRGRMTSDTSMRRSYSPRGAILATAEMLPEGPAFESAAARSLSINISRENVNAAALTEAQGSRELLPVATAGYVRWISERYDALAERAALHRSKLRTALRAELPGSHPRTPDAAACLITAIASAADYAQHVGALNATASRDFVIRARAGIIEAARAHTDATKGGDPATRFIELLASLIGGGRVYLRDRETDEHPTGWESLGWEESSDLSKTCDPRRGADFVGWADGTYLYLDKEMSYVAAAAFANRGGIPFGIKQRALWDSLKRSGMSMSDEGRTDTTARIGKKSRRVIQLPRELLTGEESRA